METLRFSVQGSAEQPYQVTIQREGRKLSASCTCPAGENGQYCKHRLGILEGSAEGVAGDDVHLVMTAASWLPGTEVAAAIQAVDAAERELERVKKLVTKAKKELGAAMRS